LGGEKKKPGGGGAKNQTTQGVRNPASRFCQGWAGGNGPKKKKLEGQPAEKGLTPCSKDPS